MFVRKKKIVADQSVFKSLTRVPEDTGYAVQLAAVQIKPKCHECTGKARNGFIHIELALS